MAGRVEEINIDILKQCREQIGLNLLEVEKHIPKIVEIEEGKCKPTFKQLDKLSKLYNVPRWVFISEKLPEKYQFVKTIPAFRQFAKNNIDIFNDSKVRSLTARVERFRELILELLDDMGEDITIFMAPDLTNNTTPESAARIIRDWLKIPDKSLDFSEWKKLLEKKGIFVFMTSKYQGWSYVDRMLLRGLTIYHSTLPIIIINDSDAKKAQLFTLLHELGHLVRKESAIDNWEYHHKKIEKWCDEFAGNVLMPTSHFNSTVQRVENLDTIKQIAKIFNVSAYACLVRLKQLRIIDRDMYDDFESQLIDEYMKIQKIMKDSPGGPARNRPKEVLTQYGHIYTNVLFQAYHNKEIGLHKLSQLFDLKKPSYVLEMEGQL